MKKLYMDPSLERIDYRPEEGILNTSFGDNDVDDPYEPTT